MAEQDFDIKERAADMLLLRAFEQSPLDIFDEAEDFSMDGEWKDLHRVKIGAEMLTHSRLARYVGDDRTQIELTNAGRYWAMSGGYLAFLKDGHPRSGGGGAGGGRNPELETMRMNFMRLRLATFWWSFGLSLAGFFISIISLTIILVGRDEIFR
jgi:hypothetical protein